MDYPNDTINSRKQKHLNYKERVKIQIRLTDGWSAYRIAKELGRASNTIRNEIKRGTVPQVKQGKRVMMYFADTGEAIYNKHRQFCCPKFKRLKCRFFIDYVCEKVKTQGLSVDACIGNVLVTGKFKREEMVCTKTFYNYIDLCLLELRNIDLPMKLRRKNKSKHVRRNKRRLGTSIEDRPADIETREEFGHWEIDTVIGRKTKEDGVLLTLTERKTRNNIIMKMEGKTSCCTMSVLENLQMEFGSSFDKVFKTITSDNGQEFADLSMLEEYLDTKVFYAHPYSSHERGTNERHNGLIRRFIPKGDPINNYSLCDIAAIGDWCNQLPRKILGYLTPAELFEKELDIIYAA